MISTHREAFQRVINTIRSDRPGASQPSEASTPRIEQHVSPMNPGDARPEERSPMYLQEELGGVPANIDVEDENILDLPASSSVDENMNQMSLLLPSHWSFRIPDDLPPGMR